MGCAVIVTPQAIEDLGSIVRYVAADSPDRARQLGQKMLDQALSIGAFPSLGRIVPEMDDAAVREIICGEYRVIYEVYPDRRTVYVLRFWHGARGAPEFRKVESPP